MNVVALWRLPLADALTLAYSSRPAALVQLVKDARSFTSAQLVELKNAGIDVLAVPNGLEQASDVELHNAVADALAHREELLARGAQTLPPAVDDAAAAAVEAAFQVMPQATQEQRRAILREFSGDQGER